LDLRRALRNGSVWIEYSLAFRSRETLFIPQRQWEESRRAHYRRLSLPTEPGAFLEPLAERAQAAVQAVAQSATEGILRVDDELHLTPLAALEEDPKLAKLRTALDKRAGEAQLPELILAVDAQVRFSWIMLGREPRSTRELLMVHAGILAHGTALSAAETARMIPQLSPASVRQAMKWASDERRLSEACGAVLTFMHRHSISATWGRSDLASADMMSLETNKRVFLARNDPRRKTASIGIYTHVRDRWGISYAQPILLNERQAGAAIEGVIRDERLETSLLAVDTHGYVVIWTPRRFRRRSLNQPIYMCVCFRRSGYASHQEAYVERRDIDHSDRRVGHTGRRGKRVSCVPVRSRVLAQHEYRLCARSFPLVAVPRRATPELVRDQARPYRRVPTVSPSRDNAASVAVYRAEACGRR
jgi:hypothetical protein